MSMDEKQNDQPPEAAPTVPPNQERPRRRGFAAMDPERVKQIASKGGRAAHAAGTAHQFSSDEARIAGKKGGMAPHVRRGGVRRQPVAERSNNAKPPESTDRGGHSPA
ncbi:MAG TPA: KGG domain-containing protein [Labilithrix sp.]|nr:KGG domain-containing protein [Labilithrix sp.]